MFTWEDVAQVLNSELDCNYTSNKYRKEYARNFKHTEEESDNSELLEDLQEKLQEMRKQKTILSDIRNDVNAQLRSIDRLEYMKEIASEVSNVIARNSSAYKFKTISSDKNDDAKEGVLVLSDWHYGLITDSYFNSFSPEVCKTRLQKILDQVIEIAQENKISTIHIFNLGDLISGRIHAQLRMQSRIDAVRQTIEVAELLRNFISELRKHFSIEYYDCLDNHSRIEPNKKESLQLESFVEIIHWHLKNMFENVSNVTINKNVFGKDIIATNILGSFVVGVHGDKDIPSTIVKNMSALIGNKPDIIFTAHRHHFGADETTKCAVLCNPSLMGQDQYALDRRLDSVPAQLFVVMKPYNPMYCVYRLVAE